MDTRIKAIEEEIGRIKKQLLATGEMRPGSLSKQKRRRGGLYHQLSYRHNGRGHTKYIRQQSVPTVRRQLDAYRRFRELIHRWTSLMIELCNLKMRREGGSAGEKGQ